MRGRVAALCFLLLLGGTAQARQIEVRGDLAYGPDPAELMDVCLPRGPGTDHAGVVMMHGGGWHAGRRRSMLGYCREFARHGLVVVNIDYRLAGTPGGEWPAQLQDAQLAVRWLRRHAGELGVDPQRICAMGMSAGAHLAVFLAVLPQTMPGDRADVLATVSSAVACAADNFGPVDFTVPVRFRDALPGLAGSHDPARLAEVARAASPLALVGPATAPIMIVQGDDDILVPPAQSAALREALLRAHVPQLYLAFPGGHSFKGLPGPEIQAILNLESEFIAATPAR